MTPTSKQKWKAQLWLPEYEWLQDAMRDYKRGLINEFQFGLLIIQRIENRR